MSMSLTFDRWSLVDHSARTDPPSRHPRWSPDPANKVHKKKSSSSSFSSSFSYKCVKNVCPRPADVLLHKVILVHFADERQRIDGLRVGQRKHQERVDLRVFLFIAPQSRHENLRDLRSEQLVRLGDRAENFGGIGAISTSDVKEIVTQWLDAKLANVKHHLPQH